MELSVISSAARETNRNDGGRVVMDLMARELFWARKNLHDTHDFHHPVAVLECVLLAGSPELWSDVGKESTHPVKSPLDP